MNLNRWDWDTYFLTPFLKGATIYVAREPCEGCYVLLKLYLITKAVFPGGMKEL